ncbi:hypothetical protein M1466_02175 [Candidatus Dependentiae bacterium]|nr:hypothetical protein [Candidatus Dependentiae bacterium]
MNRRFRTITVLLFLGCMSVVAQTCRLLRPTKSVIIEGDIASPIKSGSIEILYKDKGVRVSQRQKIVRTATSYKFTGIPHRARSIRIKRYYNDGGQCSPARGRFRIPCIENYFDLAAVGSRIIDTPIELGYDPQLPPFREGMIWRWSA